MSDSKILNESTTSGGDMVEKENDIDLKYIQKGLAYDIMSMPTVSSHEYRLVTYIVLWARRNNIKYELDEYGNVYLTKGKLSKGEFYPCVTSHLDTVQTEQLTWAQVGLPLELKTITNEENKHEWHVDGTGIGADCKSGVVISLSLFEHFDKLKACFFLEEEIGCKGSNKLVKEWFNDVGYVIGWDSPELNRAAWSCSGVPLFDKKFFTEQIQDVCKEHGLTIFNAEPFTDVKVIREKTKIVCMNFGNGGYNAHTSREYCVVEDMDHACGMGIDIIKKLGTQEFKLDTVSAYGYYTTNDKGVKTWVKNNDSDFFKAFSGYKSYSTSKSKTTATTTTTTSSTNSVEKKTDDITESTIKYIVEAYETYLNKIQQRIEEKCEEEGLDFNSLFKEIFENDSIKLENKINS